MQHTLSTLRDERGPEVVEAPVLYVALHGYAPHTAPSRHALVDLDEIVIGRGTAVSVRREGRRLELRVPDPWMSSTHAAITPALHRWKVEDLGSRNGTLVGGDAVRAAALTDGDVIEVGHTFFVFREQVAVGDAALDLDASALDDRPRGLATLIPELDARLATLDRIAPTREPVLIAGETGTGKELVARGLHALSRRPGELVAVNCGALPETLVEGALFGHARGAFSGATADRRGFVRAADRGTLLLDEIGDLRLSSQAALLRVLQEGEVTPVGEERPVAVDVRVCSATHRPLDELVDSGAFREDLLARLRGFAIELPPLRDRREDLGLLVRAILADGGARPGDVSLSSSAARALFFHDWPQNIRELARALGAARALAAGDKIQLEHLPPVVAGSIDHAAGAGAGDRRPLDDAELARRAQLVALLREHNGNIAAVCRVLGKGRQQIHRWLKRYGIDPDAYRS